MMRHDLSAPIPFMMADHFAVDRRSNILLIFVIGMVSWLDVIVCVERASLKRKEFVGPF